MNRNKIIQMVIILAAIVVIASSFSKLLSRDSMTLADYARLNTKATAEPQEENDSDSTNSSPSESSIPPLKDLEDASEGGTVIQDGQEESAPSQETLLTGAALNGNSQEANRYTLQEGFYYEPLSEKLQRYMTGASYPTANITDTDSSETDNSSAISSTADDAGDFAADNLAPSFDDLLYVHILHYDFEGNATQGELVCNSAIALDLLEIFYELYRNEYKLESVLLADDFAGQELLSMEANNSFCFNCPAQSDEHARRHNQGLAVDINPLYNPWIVYETDCSQQIVPGAASDYADRTAAFPYKIDEDDLCYKLFTQHGFTWGGNWNDGKCYQHFQKSLP